MKENSNGKIKILRIVTRLNIGGPSKQIEVLVTQLRDTEFEQLLVSGNVLTNEASYNFVDSSKFIRLEKFHKRNSILLDLKSSIKIAQILREFEADIIHTHQSKAWILGYFAKLISRSNAKLIHTFHGHVLHSYFPPIQQFLIRIISRYLANKSDSLIAVSEATKKDLLKYKVGTASKFSVIYPGFDVERKTFKKLDSIYVSPSKNILQLLFLGRIEPIKDPFFLLDVCKKLKSENFPFSLRVVGNGSLFDQFKHSVSRLELPIVLTGWQRNLDEIFKDIDLLIMCSKNEGTPISIIEAGIYGIPTMSNDVGGIRELISNPNEGFIVEKDVDKYARFLVNFHNSSKDPISKDALSKSFIIRFNSSTFLLSHEKLYRKIFYS